MTFLVFLALFFPPIAMIVASSVLKGAVGERVVAIILGVNVPAFVYLLLFHTPIGPRLMTQDAYWIGAMEEFMTTPVFIICAALRSRCFQKIIEIYFTLSGEMGTPPNLRQALEGSDFSKTTGLVLFLIVANIGLLGALARTSF